MPFYGGHVREGRLHYPSQGIWWVIIMITDPATAATTTQCDVFLSYARGDRALADRLASGLAGQGLSVAMDRTHISSGEDWPDRLEMLLRNASKVVFLATPDAVNSENCRAELVLAAEAAKPILPVLVDDLPRDRLPSGLAEINYLRLRADGDNFDDVLSRLTLAVTTDLDWERAKTDYLKRAMREPEALIRSRAELVEAETWAAARPAATIPVPPPVLDMIRRSRRRMTRLTRAGFALLGTTTAALAILAGIATEQSMKARENLRLATLSEMRAVSERDQALRAQSYFLAAQAEQHLRNDDPVTAALLALEALPGTHQDHYRPIVWEAQNALYQAYSEMRERAIFEVPRGAGTSAFLSPDGSQLLTYSFDDTARLWDIGTGNELLALRGHEGLIRSAVFSPDGAWIAITSQSGTVHLWNARTGCVFR